MKKLGLFMLAIGVAVPALAAEKTAASEAAKGCYAYGRGYAPGEEDCDGRVCGKDGNWTGVVKSGICDVTDEQDENGRDPASVGKRQKKNARHHGKKHHPNKKRKQGTQAQ